jgi:DHA3 family macrolide efflux protein-like MFS transporter
VNNPQLVDAVPLVRRSSVGVFLAFCIAQSISLFGSELTGFGLAMRFYERTHSVALNGLIVAAAMMPQILAAPFVGVFVDRGDRRVPLLVGYAAGALCTVLMLIVLGGPWAESFTVVATIVALNSCAHAAELAVLSASTASLIAREQRGRANGVVQLAVALPQVLAPTAASVLLPLITLRGLVLLELATALAAFSVVLVLRVPSPRSEPCQGPGAFSMRELSFGWRFISSHAGLMRLAALVATIHFNLGFITALLTPLVLGFSDARGVGFVLSVSGAGIIAGGICMAVWGGPQRRVSGVLAIAVTQSVMLVAAASCHSVSSVACVGFVGLFLMPIMAGSSEAVWQRKVATEVQGRVFSFRLLLNGSAFVSALLLSGLVVDRALEPAMHSGGSLSGLLGPWIGVGAGRGSAAALLFTAALSLLLVAVLGLSPRLRLLESELPDRA